MIGTKQILSGALLFSLFTITACNNLGSTVTPTEPASPVAPAPAPVDSIQQPEQLVKEILQTAHDGKVSQSRFAVGQATITEVEAEWGKPDKVDQVASIYYATYQGHQSVFGFTSNHQIVDIRSYDPALHAITADVIQKELGTPVRVTESAHETIYLYPASDLYDIKFIISTSSHQLDHLSIVSHTSPVSPPAESESPGQEQSSYILDIVGESDKLTPKAWKSMQAWRKNMVTFTKQHQGDIYLNGPNKKQVALTFDDGPDQTNTLSVINTLRENQVKGSFFFVGSKVKQHPEIVKKAYENGNLVLSHSYNHEDLTKKSTEELRTDLNNTASAIEKVIGKKPALLRPPYGETNNDVLSIATTQGYKLVLWSLDTLDWSQKEHDHIKNNVLKHVRNGDIILMHSNEDKSETAKAVPLIIAELKRQGFDIVDVATLLGVSAYQ